MEHKLRTTFNCTQTIMDRIETIRKYKSKRSEKRPHPFSLFLEAFYSVKIEGATFSSGQGWRFINKNRGRDFKAEAIPTDNTTYNDYYRELHNYYKILERIIKESPLLDFPSETELLDVIKMLHYEVTKDTWNNKSSPGKIRTIQNYVVDGTGKVHYVCPDPKIVPSLLEEYIKWIRNNFDVLDPIILAGLIHYNFVMIHPFIDGNGRTARLFTAYILLQKEWKYSRFISNKSLSLCYYISQERYYKAIQSIIRNNGDCTEWLEYFTEHLVD